MSSSWSISLGRLGEDRREGKRFRLIGSIDLNGKQKKIYSLSSSYAPRGANPSKKQFVREVKATGNFSKRWNYKSGRKPWNAIEARCTVLGTEMTKHIPWCGSGCTSLTAAPDSLCKGCHFLWLHTFLGCPCHFVQHGSPLGSQCTGQGSK